MKKRGISFPGKLFHPIWNLTWTLWSIATKSHHTRINAAVMHSKKFLLIRYPGRKDWEIPGRTFIRIFHRNYAYQDYLFVEIQNELHKKLGVSLEKGDQVVCLSPPLAPPKKWWIGYRRLPTFLIQLAEEPRITTKQEIAWVSLVDASKYPLDPYAQAVLFGSKQSKTNN